MLACMEKPTPTIRDLYPRLGDEHLSEAEDSLEQYVALVLRIYERVCADPARYAHLRALLSTDGTVQSGTPRTEGMPAVTGIAYCRASRIVHTIPVWN